MLWLDSSYFLFFSWFPPKSIICPIPIVGLQEEGRISGWHMATSDVWAETHSPPRLSFLHLSAHTQEQVKRNSAHKLTVNVTTVLVLWVCGFGFCGVFRVLGWMLVFFLVVVGAVLYRIFLQINFNEVTLFYSSLSHIPSALLLFQSSKA